MKSSFDVVKIVMTTVSLHSLTGGELEHSHMHTVVIILEHGHLFWKFNFSIERENRITKTKGKTTRSAATMLNRSWWNRK
jgi:hypothetical protein